MSTTRLSRHLPARVFLLLAVALLQTVVLAAVQPALREYNARMATFRAQLPAVVQSAQHAADNMLAHPEANLDVPSFEQMGFCQELMNRAGGLANASPTGGWGRNPTKHDIVLLSVRSWEGQAALMRKRVKEYHEKGWTVTIIGSRMSRPRDLGADFFIDNGAPSGAARYGRINVLSNVTLGWMWCCEYAAAMSRKSKFPAILQSICIKGGEDYDEKIQTPAGRRSVVDCPKAIPAGELSKLYLTRVMTLTKDLASDHVQGQVKKAADVIADRLAKGGRVGMVGMGHIILEEVKVENKTPWLGFRAVGISNMSIKAYLRPSELLVWMSYNGMNTIYEDYAKNIADAKVDLITCYAPDPEWAKNPPPTLAHIDQSWKLPDAEVPIPVFPNFMAPVSGINVTLLLRMLDDETAARLRRVKLPPQTPVVLPPEFVERIAEQIYEGGSGGGVETVRKWGFVDGTGKETGPARYDEVGPMENGLAPVHRDGKCGYVDATGAEVIAPAFEKAESFYGDVAKVGMGGKLGLIDKTGKVVLPLQYDGIETAPWWKPAPDFIMVSVGGKWGLVDRAGKELFPPRYDEMDMFCKDKVVVKSAGKYGVVTRTGAEVVPPQYDSLWGAWDNAKFAMMSRDGKWGMIDLEGKEVVPPTYDDIAGSIDDTVIIKQGGKWGAVNGKGVELVAPKYSDITGYGEFLLTVKTPEGKFAAINMKTGKEAVPPLYESMLRPTDGTVAVKRDGKWGYLDTDGKEIVPAIYDEALPFQGGNAAVKRGGKRLFIDKTGAEVKAPDYDFFTAGGDGFFKVVRGGLWGFTDKAGKEIVPPKYTFVLGFEKGAALVYAGGAWATPVGRTPMLQGGKWGLIDPTGKELVPPKYDRIVPLGDALFAVGTDVEAVMPQP